ncbi:MAG TPA: VIT and VWA domain-containing protein [Synergistaceae bacterium]|nr:VIT and VWA domain-containing protein [Synergistaceae bacterium]
MLYSMHFALFSLLSLGLLLMPSLGESSEFSPERFDNAASGGVAVMEILSTKDEGGSASQINRFVPLRKTDIAGTVTGPLASVSVTHRYGFTKEEHPDPVEALYRFPLPGDAAVTSCTVSFGEISIVTELKERKKAEAEYEEAKQEGKQAVLLTRESPNVFTLAVQGIRPDEEVTVETTYVQMGDSEKAGWSLRIPLTTAPRFLRQDELGSSQAKGNPLAVYRDPGHRFSLNLTFTDPCEIESPTHDILIPKGENEIQHLTLSRGAEIPDRDFVVAWIPKAPEEKTPASCNIYEYTPEGSSSTWFFGLLTPAPPAMLENHPRIPREVILLVDHSGSMSGAKWEAADWAVISFLNNLAPKDHFSLGLFHDSVSWFTSRPLPATRENITKAVDFLTRNKDDGGTNLGVALEQAVHTPRPEEGIYSQHILVITDAQVTDNGRILRLVEREARRSEGRKFSILCIDAAPNDYLAREIARKGKGIARFLTSSPEETDISTALEEVLEEWGSPVLAQATLKIHLEKGKGEHLTLPQSSRVPFEKKQVASLLLGDLPQQRARWVVGRIDGKEMGNISYSLEARGIETPLEGKVRRVDAREGKSIKALYGALVLNRLEQLYHGNYPQKELALRLEDMGYALEAEEIAEQAIYQENAASTRESVITPLLLKESLFYGLPCEVTAFVAVRHDSSVGSTTPVIVGNALPGGWDESFAGGAPRPLYMAAPEAQVRMSLLRKTSGPPTAGTMAMDNAAMPAPQAPLYEEAEELMEQAPGDSGPLSLYQGTPGGSSSQVLYEDHLKGLHMLTALQVETESAYRGKAVLLLYVGDMAIPRARIPLEQLLLMGGRRPLHISAPSGILVKLVLEDPEGNATIPLAVTLHF